ncbi:MAG: hypothetical protein AB7H66_01130 [Hyphomonadaceae bacterium]
MKPILLAPFLIAAANVAIAGLSALAVRAGNPVALGFGVAAVLALTGIQFLLWRWVHARLPLSLSYPLTSVMYPGFAVLAWVQTGRISAFEIAGVAIVMLGVSLCMGTAPANRDA